MKAVTWASRLAGPGTFAFVADAVPDDTTAATVLAPLVFLLMKADTTTRHEGEAFVKRVEEWVAVT